MKKEVKRENGFKEFKVNFSKVTWPKPLDGLKSTVMVLLISIAAGSLISFADFIGKCGVSLFIK